MTKATSDDINKRVQTSLFTIISSTRHSRFTVDMVFLCFSNFVRASTYVNCWRKSLRLWKNLCLSYRFSTRFSVSGLADVSSHDMNRMAIYRESRNNSSVSARQIAACNCTFKLRLHTAIYRADFRFRCMLSSEEQADDWRYWAYTLLRWLFLILTCI